MNRINPDVNFLCLIKGRERYVFLWDDAHRAEVLRTIGRFASDPLLSLTWFDAATLNNHIREMVKQCP